MRITITESQLQKLVEDKKILKEYMDSSFDWDEFNLWLERGGAVGAKAYCIEKLGRPIGEGTSRAVFEIDDHTVLKLSLSKNDVMQNLHEYNTYEKLKDNPLLPRIYDHSDDYVWLWCEKVIGCTEEDFEKILGIPYNLRGWDDSDPDYEPIGYDEYENPSDIEWDIKDEDGDEDKLDFERFKEWWNDYCEDWEDLWNENERKTFREWLKHPWFQYLAELMEHQPTDEFFIDNFGIALRNGKPTIVVLDIGYQ